MVSIFMKAFEFCCPTQIVFGPGVHSRAGELAKAHGASRVLVVCGSGSAVKSGLLDRIEDSLREAGLEWTLLEGVRPNPRLSLARAGVEKALELGADFILAVGGGSVIDTAKAVADGAANPGTGLWDIWTQQVQLERALPVGAVLTIPAAGSECSDSAVLTRDDTLVKRGLGHPLHRPRFALMDPELTATLPPYQVACGTVDIMMHTMDRYFNPVTGNLLTDELAEGLLRTVIRCGRQALEKPGDYEAMSELMWAGSLSHNGLTGLGGMKDFAPHQLGHELSAKFDAAHGATLSAVWDSWARYCVDAGPARLAQFAQNVWGLEPGGRSVKELALAGIQATADYFTSLDMPVCLSQLGCGVLEEAVLEDLARRCTFYGQRTIGTFRVLDYEDILAIYRMANH